MAMDASNLMAKATTFETFRQHQTDELIESISSASDEQKLERLDKRAPIEQRKYLKKLVPCNVPALSMTKEILDSTIVMTTTTTTATISSETDIHSTTKNKRKNFKPRSTAITDGQNDTNLLDMRMRNSIIDQRQRQRQQQPQHHRIRTQDIISSATPSTIIIEPSSHSKNNENRLNLESCGNYAATAAGRKLVHISNSLSPTTLLNSLTELSHGHTRLETVSDAPSHANFRLKSLSASLCSQNNRRLDTDVSSLTLPSWPLTSTASSSSLSTQTFASNAFTAVQELLSVYGLSMSPNDIVDAFSHRSDASAICDFANNGKFSIKCLEFLFTLSGETSSRVEHFLMSIMLRKKVYYLRKKE